MKHIKKFNQVFESGLPSKETYFLQSAIRDLISSGTYRPNIKNNFILLKRLSSIRDFLPTYLDKPTRDFNVLVSGSESKFGLVIDIIFGLDFPVGYDEINSEFKQATFILEIGEIISKMMNKQATLYGFDFFGKKVMGQKDGRTLEVEDVLPKFNSTIEQLDSVTDLVSDGSPIKLYFLVK